MYKLKSNKLKVKFVTSKQRMVFERYEIMVGPGDVLVSLDNKLCFVCSQEAFSKVAELAVKEKKSPVIELVVPEEKPSVTAEIKDSKKIRKTPYERKGKDNG